MPKPVSPNAAATSPPSSRLVSLDALRGFDMLWILGGDSIGHALGMLGAGGALGLVATQLDHVAWEGFRFYDLIFPLFVFIVGVSLVFSLTRVEARGGRSGALWRVLRRTVLLYALGIFYYEGWSEGLENVRLLGVLQRIALCYGAASVLFLFFRTRGLIVWCVGLLAGYWALMTFVPVPGVGAGNFEEGKNLANWIDARYLPGFKWDGDHDPEGILSTIPAVASCLIGVLSGIWLRRADLTDHRKLLGLAGVGAGMVLCGFVWGLQFPVIKKIWTSSYVLVAGGYSLLFLALFYWLIDMRRWKSWAWPFVWIGMNPITLYMLGNLIEFDAVVKRVLGGPVSAFLDRNVSMGWGAVSISLGGMALAILIAWFLHRRKLFLRI